MFESYTCAITGAEAEPDELSVPDPDADDLYTMPVGWVEVTIRRRYHNPVWLKVQEVKEQTVQAALQSIPEEQREMAAPTIRIQVAASFAALEATMQRYITTTEIVHVSDPDANEAVRISLDEIRDTLGLPETPKAETGPTSS